MRNLVYDGKEYKFKTADFSSWVLVGHRAWCRQNLSDDSWGFNFNNELLFKNEEDYVLFKIVRMK